MSIVHEDILSEESFIDGSIPYITVTPQVIYFLEGDEPLIDVIHLENVGSSTIIYRICAATPNRFVISSMHGSLKPQEQHSCNIELRNFPPESTQGNDSLADFFVEYVLFHEEYNSMSHEEFWRDIHEICVRKVVSSRAISWDDREIIENRIRTEVPSDALITYNGYKDINNAITMNASASEIHSFVNHSMIDVVNNSMDLSTQSEISTSQILQQSIRRQSIEGNITIDMSNQPQVSVAPKVIYFLEGDDPLEACISLTNTGFKAISYRISASTPNRFIMSSSCGIISPDDSVFINIELRNFPSQVLHKDVPLAQFHVDFILIDSDTNTNNIQNYWISIQDKYIRKIVLSHAVAFDNRQEIEDRIQQEPLLEAPVAYDGYSFPPPIASPVRNSPASRGNASRPPSINFDTSLKSVDSLMNRIPSSIVKIDSVAPPKLNNPRPSPIHVSGSSFESLRGLTESTETLNKSNIQIGTSDSTLVIFNSSNSTGDVPSHNQENEKFKAQTEKIQLQMSAVMSELASYRQILDKEFINYENNIQVKLENIAEETVELMPEFLIDQTDKKDDKNSHQSALDKLRSRKSVIVTTPTSNTSPGVKKGYTGRIWAISDNDIQPLNNGVAENEAETITQDKGLSKRISRRHSADEDILEVELERRKSLVNMSNVLSDFSSKLGSGELRLRRSSITSKASKKRLQYNEEINSQPKSVLGELKNFHRAMTGGIEISLESDLKITEDDEKALNARGEIVSETDLVGFTVLSAIQVDANVCTSTGVGLGDDVRKVEDKILGNYVPELKISASIDSFDEKSLNEESSSDNDFNSNEIAKSDDQALDCLTDQKEYAANNHKIGFVEEAKHISVRIDPTDYVSINFENLKHIDELKSQILLQNHEINDLNRKIDDMQLLQQANALQIQHNNDIETQQLHGQYRSQISKLTRDSEMKIENLKYEHSKYVNSLASEKNEEIEELKAEIKNLKVSQSRSTAQIMDQREFDIQKLMKQYDVELDSLRRLVEEHKNEKEAMALSFKEQKMIEISSLTVSQESTLSKLSLMYEQDTSQMRSQIDILKKEMEAIERVNERKLNLLTSRYQDEIELLTKHIEAVTKANDETSVVQIDINRVKDAEYNRKIKQYQTDISNLKSSIEDLKQQKDIEIIDVRNSLTEEFQLVKNQYENATNKLNIQLIDASEKYKEQFLIFQQQKDNENRLLQQQYEVKINSIISTYEAKIAHLTKQLEVQPILDIVKECENTIQALNAAKHAEILSIQKQYDAKTLDICESHKVEIESLHVEIESLKSEHAEYVKRLIQQHESNLKILSKDHASVINSMQRQLENTPLSYDGSGNCDDNISVNQTSPSLSQQQQESRIHSLEELNKFLESKIQMISNQKDIEIKHAIKQAESKIESMMIHIELLTNNHDEALKTLKQQHEMDVKQLTQQYELKINNSNQQRELRKVMLQTQQENVIEELKQSYQSELNAAMMQKDEEIKLIIRQFESKQRLLFKQVEQFNSQRENDAKAFEAKMNEEIKLLTEKHETEINMSNIQQNSRYLVLGQQYDAKVLAIRQELENEYLSKQAELNAVIHQKDSKIRSLLSDHDSELRILKREIEELKQEISEQEVAFKQQKGSEFRSVARKHENELMLLRNQMEEMQQSNNEIISSLKDQTEKNMLKQTRKYEAEADKIRKEYEQCIFDVKKIEADNIEKLNGELSKKDFEYKALLSKFNALITDNEQAIRELNLIKEAEIIHAIQQQQEQNKLIQIESEMIISKMKKELDDINDLLLKRESQLSEQHIIEINRLRGEHESQILKLQMEVNELSSKLRATEASSNPLEPKTNFGAAISEGSMKMEFQKNSYSRDVSVSPVCLKFNDVENSTDIITIRNNSNRRIAYRVKVSIPNLFLVKGGEGLLRSSDGATISVIFKPSVNILESEINSVAKFAVDIIEADNRYDNMESKVFWRLYSKEGVRKYVLTKFIRNEVDGNVNEHLFPETSKSSKNIKTLLSKMRDTLSESQVTNKTSGRNSPLDNVLKIGSVVAQQQFEDTRKHTEETMKASVRTPKGKLLDLLIKNCTRGTVLTSDEAEVLNQVRGLMSADLWEEWVETAEQEKHIRDRESNISQFENKDIFVSRTHFEKERARITSFEQESELFDHSVNILKNALLEDIRSSLRDDVNASSDIMNNYLVDEFNFHGNTPVRDSGLMPKDRSITTGSPLNAAKALTTSLHSNKIDIDDVKTKLNILENIVKRVGANRQSSPG